MKSLPSELTQKVTVKINEVIEEETSRKLGELNVITEVSETPDGNFRIQFSPLSPCSPLAVNMGRGIRDAGMSVDGVKHVTVECSGHMQDELVNKLVNREKSPT
ncbi:MAG: hypothetical protein OK422_04485 [Thaumarchaeota archaeon]|nr:hypothetical protein [Nitrososphaerota archaeon]